MIALDCIHHLAWLNASWILPPADASDPTSTGYGLSTEGRRRSLSRSAACVPIVASYLSYAWLPCLPTLLGKPLRGAEAEILKQLVSFSDQEES